ncbi:unnamed protein product [Ilex paraguariensis]|uniref:Uncharacterized protein n=1 Tax=Ilex paraguariensis TaxID=185542 RepID=A0ABC8UUF1_9AQUA
MASIHQCSYLCLALLILFGVWASQASSRLLNDEQSMSDRHEQWMAHYGCVYIDIEEKDRRFQIFKDNVKRVGAFNADLDRRYKLSANQFCRPNKHGVSSFSKWLQGCCWSFSAVAAMEGITQLTTGKLVSLSEQELVDCDVRSDDQGCQGGLMDTAFQFIKQNKGLTTKSNYPYTGRTCNTKKSATPAAKIIGYEDVPSNSEKALLQAIASSIGTCDTQLDHGVTAVGYGTTTDGTKYWLVKNSWGTGWSENG